MEFGEAITAFVTMFVVIDPIALAPLFIVLTRGMSHAQRMRIAVRACLTGAGVLMVFGLVGDVLLSTIGISMAAFRISGGLLLFLTAVEMLFEKRTERREHQADDQDDHDPSVFPLAIPMLSGPGAMTTMILLGGKEGAGWSYMLVVNGVMLAVIGLAFALFMIAAPMERALGATGTKVITRLLGMLLAALSVQFVLDGFRDLGVGPF